jgi:hypothetical protein
VVGIVAALVVSLGTHAAGAGPVAIGLRATYDMRCGWPGPSIAVVFPAAERLPAHVGRAAVQVNGKPPAAVTQTGRTVSLTIARPAGAMCDSITEGTARITFTRAAGIRNPSRAGQYEIEVRHGTTALSGRFSIR